MDFVLNRYYSLAKSNAYLSRYNISGTILRNDGVNDLENHYEENDDFAYQIANGWYYDLPIIDFKGGKPYLYNGSNGVYELGYTVEQRNEPYSLGGDPSVMRIWQKRYGFHNGQEYSFFEGWYKDGKKAYFNSSGALIGIVDRHGNTIKFQHTMASDSTATFGLLKITKAIDSVGREITFTDSGLTVTNPANPGDVKTVTYNTSLVNGIKVLDSVVDIGGRTTQYQYNINPAHFDFLRKEYISWSLPGTNQYVCLKKITYPTGGETHFNVAKYSKNLGFEGFMEFYKLYERYEKKKDGSMKNYYKYSYLYNNSVEVDGYPKYYQEIEIPAYLSFETAVEDTISNKSHYLYKYDRNFNGVNRLYVLDTQTDEGSSHKTVTTNTYKNYNLGNVVTKISRKIFNKLTGVFSETFENFDYDVAGYKDLIGYWGPEAQRDANGNPLNDENKVTYEYQENYHYPITKTYKKDASTTIKEEFVPEVPYNVGKFIKYHSKSEGVEESTLVYHEPTKTEVEAIKFHSGASFASIWAQYRALSEFYYYIEFDYWSDGNVDFEATVNYYYDYRKQYTATPTVQHAVWKFYPPSYSLNNTGLRFSTYSYSQLPTNLYITNVKIYYENPPYENILAYKNQYGKNIVGKNIYENGVKKEMTIYDHDQFGNIIEERKYKDGFSDYVSTKYSFADNVVGGNGLFNGAYLTRKWTENVKDADGNLVAAKSGNVAGTVDEVYKYDAWGNLLESVDPNGNATKYEVDALGRVTRQINPDNTSKLYSCNDVENSVSETNERGYRNKTGFDEFGNLEYVLDLDNNQYLEHYEYDGYERLIRERNNADKKVIKHSYYSDGRKSKIEIFDSNNTLLQQEDYLIDDANNNGQYRKITRKILGDNDSPTIESSIYVNKSGVIEKEDRKLGNNTYTDTYTYDYLGNKTMEKYARAYNEKWNVSWTGKFTTDYQGRLLSDQNLYGVKSKEYDALGRVKSQTDPKGNVAKTKYSTIYVYDDLGRLLEEKVPFQNVKGIMIYSIKRYYYDRNGNVILQKTSKNYPGQALSFNQTAYEYDSRNRLTNVITYNANKQKNYTQYYYDAVGNKVRMYTGLSSPLTISGIDNVITSGDKSYSVTKYEYNRQNKMTKMTDPTGLSETYTYDYNGNMTSKKDRNGSTHTYTYDGLSRLLSESVVTSNGSGNVTSTYTYTLTGNKKSASTGSQSVSYKYDALGRLRIEIEQGGVVKVYAYDAANNRKATIVRKNKEVLQSISYRYDRANRLNKVLDSGTTLATYAYDANGNRIVLKNGNGTETRYTYNFDNKVTQLINYANPQRSSILSKFVYTYYLDGNQRSKSQLGNKVTFYGYDGLGRLTSETEKVNGTTTFRAAYTFDDYNNRKTMSVSGASPYSVTYYYDLRSRLTSERKNVGGVYTTTAYTYDKNGNQLTKAVGGSTTTNIYDGLNRLTSVNQGAQNLAYTYNTDGLRQTKSVNGVVTRHVWDGQNMIVELDGAGAQTARYIRGTNLIMSVTEGVKKYYLYNAHGDVVQLTNESRNVVKSYDYDAFGVEKNQDPADTNVWRYSGEYFDKETGLQYLRARYYDPVAGRFTSEDSVWGKERDPLSLNLYTYCHNNPVMFTDPTGHWAEGDEKFSPEAQKKIEQYTLMWLYAESAYKQGIVNKREENGIKSLANRLAEQVRYQERNPLKAKISKVSEFVLYVIFDSMETGDEQQVYAESGINKITSSNNFGKVLASVALPPALLKKNKYGKVEHYYPDDHGPAHAHVTDNKGNKVKIGQNGHPLKGQPELNTAQKKVVEEFRKDIRKTLQKAGKYLKFISKIK